MTPGLLDEVVRALGLVDAQGRPLGPAAKGAAIRVALGAVRPQADAPTIGEAVEALERALARGAPRGTRKALSELSELVTLAAYGRSKRAERARTLAALLILLELAESVGAAPSPDPEAAVRDVRRAVERALASRR